ncbi:MAG: sulfotransferase [Dehalococcoidia bacterium]
MDRFIVGTGRCGSTLLSRMMAEHPSVLSVFEFFNGLDMTRRFSPEPMDGAAFATLISQEHPFVTMVLSRGYEVPEITYPFGDHARYKRDDRLPWILVSTLPRLTDDPDALFDETVAFASCLPRQQLSLQYRQLFEWLAERLGRTCWIERSGSSIDYVGALDALFPEARFLHLHRDGPETALSMREHHAYRLAISLMFQLSTDGEPSIENLRAIDQPGAPDRSDRISQLLKSRPPVEYFGRYWSQELENGLPVASKLGAERYLDARFEDMVAQPQQTLARIGAFFELDDGGDWIERAAGLVRGIPPTRFDTLSSAEQESLAEACRPGMRLLGRE